MTRHSSGRAKSVLVEAARPLQFPSLEFHLRQLNRFFIEENIFTAFPACRAYVDETKKRLAREGRPPQVTVCLLFTFQESSGAMVPATAEELQQERAALRKAVQQDGATNVAESTNGSRSGETTSPSSPASTADTRVSYLMGRHPESLVWKDSSRERFFEFCRHITDALVRSPSPLGNSRETQKAQPVGDGATAFFLDWCDPATGLPMNTERGSSAFVDGDAIEQMFPFHSVLVAGAGCCRMIEHPVFGLCVYPASAVLAFATDQLALVKAALLSLCT